MNTNRINILRAYIFQKCIEENADYISKNEIGGIMSELKISDMLLSGHSIINYKNNILLDDFEILLKKSAEILDNFDKYEYKTDPLKITFNLIRSYYAYNSIPLSIENITHFPEDYIIQHISDLIITGKLAYENNSFILKNSMDYRIKINDCITYYKRLHNKILEEILY